MIAAKAPPESSTRAHPHSAAKTSPAKSAAEAAMRFGMIGKTRQDCHDH
jgi:hypothetical protein